MILSALKVLELNEKYNLIEGLSERELKNPEGSLLDLRIGQIHNIIGESLLGVKERYSSKTETIGDVRKDGNKRFTIKPGEYYLVTTMEVVSSPAEKIKYDENSKMAWSFVDVETSDVDNIGVRELIDDIISRSPQVEVIVLFHKISEYIVRVYVYSSKHSSLKLVNGLVQKDKILGDDDLLSFEFLGASEDYYINILEAIKRNLNIAI